jgi:glucose-6-phosphate 1-dehydrogenase
MADTEIHPSVVAWDIVCAETPAPPTALVVFGASGDLVFRKLLPSLAEIQQRGLLSEPFCLIGCGRTEYSDEQFRQLVRQAIQESAAGATAETIASFIEKVYYATGDYSDPAFYERIKARLNAVKSRHGVTGCDIFYMAVPPMLYGEIADRLGEAGLSRKHLPNACQCARLVVEKPFGRDLKTAVELNDTLSKWFLESQIYRIDHYLGKETVQNIMIARFANAIFEPVWNRNHVDNIQITIAETVGVEHRAGYYDKTGALRDMFQNHVLQMVALVAMEPPITFDADQIRDEKVKLLRSIRPFDPRQLSESIARGQYGEGAIDGQKTIAYHSEPGVAPDSRTETFVAARLFIDNWRWKDVPFYLRTGKRLARKNTEIAVTFRQVPYSLFGSVGIGDLPANVLVMQIQPEEGMSLRFQAKRPGSKICMGTLDMRFKYRETFGVDMPESYERLLLDCMSGDQTLFTRFDNIIVSWQLLDPILNAWQNDPARPISYPAGSESFPEADALLAADRRHWRRLTGA